MATTESDNSLEKENYVNWNFEIPEDTTENTYAPTQNNFSKDNHDSKYTSTDNSYKFSQLQLNNDSYNNISSKGSPLELVKNNSSNTMKSVEMKKSTVDKFKDMFSDSEA
jgi:hypothetical protein